MVHVYTYVYVCVYIYTHASQLEHNILFAFFSLCFALEIHCTFIVVPIKLLI